MSVFDDLVAEQDRFEEILAGLDEAQWAAPSAAAGWSVADVVLHLAQGEEGVIATACGDVFDVRPRHGATVEETMDRLVREERSTPEEAFRRWREARRASVVALRATDPYRRLAWVERPMKPATLATTRLTEHWAHGLDVTGPLGIDFPDTDRLRHVAWLAHRSLPYALSLAGCSAYEVRCEVTAPGGTDVWRFGPAGTESVISGPAGTFCRVATRRLPAEGSGLHAAGPHAAAALRVLRTYAA